jgi:hypothetical protein
MQLPGFRVITVDVGVGQVGVKRAGQFGVKRAGQFGVK